MVTTTFYPPPYPQDTSSATKNNPTVTVSSGKPGPTCKSNCGHHCDIWCGGICRLHCPPCLGCNGLRPRQSLGHLARPQDRAAFSQSQSSSDCTTTTTSECVTFSQRQRQHQRLARRLALTSSPASQTRLMEEWFSVCFTHQYSSITERKCIKRLTAVSANASRRPGDVGYVGW